MGKENDLIAVGRVARACADIPDVENVWPDTRWPRTLLASALSGRGDL